MATDEVKDKDLVVGSSEYNWLKKKALRKVDKARKKWNIRSNTFNRHQVAELMVEFLYHYTDPTEDEEEENKGNLKTQVIPDGNV